MNRLQKYAPLILRLSLGAVFVWFGSQQLGHPDAWTGYIPASVLSMTGLSANMLVHFNGLFEVLFGTMLFFGFYTRITAALLFLHMLDITYVVGYTSIGVRDFGLSMGALSAFLYGADMFTLDSWIRSQPIVLQ